MSETIGWEDVLLLIDDLRVLAKQMLFLKGSAQSLQPTALVLTALRRQRLQGREWHEVTWTNRRYFFGAVREAMRRALIDHARTRNRKKRQAIKPIPIGEFEIEDLPRLADEQPESFLKLERALRTLREMHPDWAEVIEFQYVMGLKIDDIAALLDKSEKTVRTWSKRARLLLKDEITTRANDIDSVEDEA